MEVTGSLSASLVFSPSSSCWVTSTQCSLRFELYLDLPRLFVSFPMKGRDDCREGRW